MKDYLRECNELSTKQRIQDVTVGSVKKMVIKKSIGASNENKGKEIIKNKNILPNIWPKIYGKISKLEENRGNFCENAVFYVISEEG